MSAPHLTERLPMLAKAFLVYSQRPTLQRRWRHSRNECRRLLRCCRRTTYFGTAAAKLDLEFILCLFSRVTDNRMAPADTTANPPGFPESSREDTSAPVLATAGR